MRRIFAAAAALALLLCAGTARAADPDALWKIVHDRCVADFRESRQRDPCVEITLVPDEAHGVAVLKDIVGATQYLLIPTARIGGIESPEILAPDAPNYFAAAWAARSYMLARVGHALPRDAISLAINSMVGRSQNQLHIHIDCVRADIRDLLAAHQGEIGTAWTALTMPPVGQPADVGTASASLAAPLTGYPYRVRRIDGADLGETNPFRLVADEIPGAREDMGHTTIVVVGAHFADGVDGFILLANRANPAVGYRASGEELQDHDCALAH